MRPREKLHKITVVGTQVGYSGCVMNFFVRPPEVAQEAVRAGNVRIRSPEAKSGNIQTKVTLAYADSKNVVTSRIGPTSPEKRAFEI